VNLCNACQSNDFNLPERQERISQKFSYGLGPLAVLWISDEDNKENLCWRLIKDRLVHCFGAASHLVGDVRPKYTC
jgi:hypothetical protein